MSRGYCVSADFLDASSVRTRPAPGLLGSWLPLQSQPFSLSCWSRAPSEYGSVECRSVTHATDTRWRTSDALASTPQEAAASPATRVLMVPPGHGSGGTFGIEAATVPVTPSSLEGPCLDFFPGMAGFPTDTGFPAAAGHVTFTSVFVEPEARGSFPIHVNQIP